MILHHEINEHSATTITWYHNVEFVTNFNFILISTVYVLRHSLMIFAGMGYVNEIDSDNLYLHLEINKGKGNVDLYSASLQTYIARVVWSGLTTAPADPQIWTTQCYLQITKLPLLVSILQAAPQIDLQGQK